MQIVKLALKEYNIMEKENKNENENKKIILIRICFIFKLRAKDNKILTNTHTHSHTGMHTTVIRRQNVRKDTKITTKNIFLPILRKGI